MKINHLFYFLCLIPLLECCSPANSELPEFILDEGLAIELVAQEPLLDSPVRAISDQENNLFVVEMPGYMRDIDGMGEELKDGRIVVLFDTNGDQIYDNRQVLLDSLLNPRAVALAYGGLLFTDGNSLKWGQLLGESPSFQLNKIEIVDSNYVMGGNIEHQPNGLIYNLDNWIYSAKSKVRYQRQNGQWHKEATTFRGQWGITKDKRGHLIYNNNSVPLLGDRLHPSLTKSFPYFSSNQLEGKRLTATEKVFPYQATSVNRGYAEGVLDSMGQLKNYTSACSPHIFYGNQLNESYYENAFVCAPEVNLISRYTKRDQGAFFDYVAANQPNLIVSKEESFRPVDIFTGHDGALYIVDMRKGIIQHSAYMSSYLRQRILDKGLEKIKGKGRIYRLSSKKMNVHENAKQESTDLLEKLDSKDLTQRIEAQKQLINLTNDKRPILKLIEILSKKGKANAKIHILWILDYYKQLNISKIIETQNEANLDLLEQQIYLLSRFEPTQKSLKFLKKALELNQARIDFAVASSLGNLSNAGDIWGILAAKYRNSLPFSEALVNNMGHLDLDVVRAIQRDYSNDTLGAIIKQALENKNNNINYAPTLPIKPIVDDRTAGLETFRKNCASCHGLDGKGLNQLAPSLISSSVWDGSDSNLAYIILNGFDSGTEKYNLAMPAYKNDKKITDQDIVDLVSFLRSTFSDKWASLKVKQVEKLRKESTN